MSMTEEAPGQGSEFQTVPPPPMNDHGGVDLEALLRERPISLSPELAGLGLTAASFEQPESNVEGDVPPETSGAVDPIRSTPQFQRAAHHIALTQMYTAEQLAGMDASEVFRLGEIAGRQVTETSVLRQQLAEAQKPGEVAKAPEGRDAVPDPELESKLRKILEPVYESEGEKEGDKALRAALKTVADAIPKPPPEVTQPVAATPTPTDMAGAADLKTQILVARAELKERFPQLANDVLLRAACEHSDTMTPTVPFADAKSAIEAAALELFGGATSPPSAVRFNTEAARSNGSPQTPSLADRKGADPRSQMDKEFEFYKQIRKNPGDVEGNMKRAGLT